MKISKLFERIDSFFDMEKKDREKESKQYTKLLSSLTLKIKTKKEKIKASTSKAKTKKLKKELEVLQELLIKLKKKSYSS